MTSSTSAKQIRGRELGLLGALIVMLTGALLWADGGYFLILMGAGMVTMYVATRGMAPREIARSRAVVVIVVALYGAFMLLLRALAPDCVYYWISFANAMGCGLFAVYWGRKTRRVPENEYFANVAYWSGILIVVVMLVVYAIDVVWMGGGRP